MLFKTKVNVSIHKTSVDFALIKSWSDQDELDKFSAQPGHRRAATAVLYFVWRRRGGREVG